MYLFLSIILSLVLGWILVLMVGPFLGGLIAIGIVMGCIFRGLYLLNDIHKKIVPKSDKVEEAYKNYLEEREKFTD
ncbi:hypothetical protein ACIQXF_12010 [Lysinibacillus sp. NPDC097231]|uniref:hypothetical protein n=1 Tax=Lysinibacillus sp. NPDC097231 TaxID=3364142 RepID=UPI0037F8C4B1